MDSVSAAGRVSTDVTSPRPRAGANTAAVGSEGTCVASPPTVTCPSSSSLPAKPVGILELALPGLGHGWTWPWVGQRGQRGCAGLWDRGHPEPLGTTRVTLFRSMSLYLPAQQERASSPCPGSLDLLGSGRGRCLLLSAWGRQGGFGVPLHPGSHGSQSRAKVHPLLPAQLPEQGGARTPVSPESGGQAFPRLKPGLCPSSRGCPCITPRPWGRQRGQGGLSPARAVPLPFL